DGKKVLVFSKTCNLLNLRMGNSGTLVCNQTLHRENRRRRRFSRFDRQSFGSVIQKPHKFTKFVVVNGIPLDGGIDFGTVVGRSTNFGWTSFSSHFRCLARFDGNAWCQRESEYYWNMITRVEIREYSCQCLHCARRGDYCHPTHCLRVYIALEFT